MWLRKKKFKSLIGFLSVNKIDNYNRVAKGWERKQKEKKITQQNLQNKSKNKNDKCYFWVTAVRVLSLVGSHSSPQPPEDAL